jgi:5-methylcytosine-specific restriction endonuclease McrA
MERVLIELLVIAVVGRVLLEIIWEIGRRRRKRYYNDEYLKSDAWQRKRAVVLKRDQFRCRHCGRRATQVHHRRYARDIGHEPIEWLESVCDSCHRERHA